MKKLGIIAGAGQLPKMVAEACVDQARPFCIYALEGYASPDVWADKKFDVRWIKIGAVGKNFQQAKDDGIEEIVMIGAVKRPSFSQLALDWRGVQFLAKAGIKALGDDGLLKAVIAEVEKEGFHVIGADKVLKGMLAPLGVYGKINPDSQAYMDIEKGYKVARQLGQADVGQSVVVADGLVLGVEAIEGTDALIERTAQWARSVVKPVLIKVKKPQQETRADLPTIGVQTIQNAAKAGFAGVAIEYKSTFVVDKKTVEETADSLGLFVVGIDEKWLKKRK